MSPEKGRQAGSPRINTTEREELIEIIAGYTNDLSERYAGRANWRDARRYMGLVTMMGVIASDWIKPKQAAHIKKMMAHEAESLPENDRVKGRTGLLRAVGEVAGEEIEFVQGLKGRRVLSKPYKNALDDLSALNEKLITDPMTLSLRRSVRETKERKAEK